LPEGDMQAKRGAGFDIPFSFGSPYGSLSLGPVNTI
jgi:hypothetical protein